MPFIFVSLIIFPRFHLFIFFHSISQVSPAVAALGCATAASFRSTDLPLLLGKHSLKVLLSFKFFDVRTQRLEFVGSRVVLRSATIGDLVPMLREMIADRPGVDAAAPLRVWEEVNATKGEAGGVAEYQMGDQLAAKSIITGDIFCFADAFPREQLAVLLKERQASHEAVVSATRAKKSAERAQQRAEESARRAAEEDMDEAQLAAAKKVWISHLRVLGARPAPPR